MRRLILAAATLFVAAAARPALAANAGITTNVDSNGSIFSFTINQAPGNDFYTGDFVNVAACNGGNPLPFRCFRLDIQSSWGGDNSFYGLSEIMFEGTIVPEPGSALLLGIATAGLLSRRRRATG